MRYTLILGAGASTPFIGNCNHVITTETIIIALTDFNRWNNLINQFTLAYTGGDTSYVFNIDGREITDLIVNIKNNIENHFGYVTFDQIMHILEPICIRFSNDIFGGEYENINEEFVDLSKFSYTNTTSDGWMYVPYICREVICSFINEVYSRRLNKKIYYIRMIRNWIIHNNKNDELQFYSFNYDNLLSDSIKKTNIDNCFVNKNFDVDKFWNTENTLCQLHGSVNGYLIGDEYIHENNAKVAQNIRIEKSNSRTVGEQIKIYEKGSVGKHYNTWLVTTLEKIETFAIFPFSVFFQKLSLDIFKSDCIIIIGSSLGDVHINSFIINSIKTQKKKVVIVTKIDLNSFLDNFTDISINNENLLVGLIVKMGITIKSRGNSIDQAVREFNKRVFREYNKNKYFYLGSNVAVVPDGSKLFYRNKYLLKNIMSGFI
ncbi:hypothetical protein Spiaf_1007 [Spirochaeta africana DSM 8902]|uniref:Uncharacterized protein n=2 Tax=Spirochaeta TaxID=146 RepID=H9UHV2_SPIAZ|nr:hypothetical protein Spiaf_1007 [Spirochaeta africana DSM 8902]